MTDHDIHGCGRAGMWFGVLCAALGVLTAFGMIKAMNLEFILGLSNLPREVTIGLIALFIGARCLGKKAGVFLCSKGNRLGLNVLTGIGVAFGSIAIAVLAGLFVGLLGELDQILNNPDIPLMNFVWGPLSFLLLVYLFGGGPALVLGALFGFLVTTRLERLTR